MFLSHSVFQAVKPRQQAEPPAPDQVRHHLLVAAQALGPEAPDGLRHLRPAADGLHRRLLLPGALGVPPGVLIADGDEQPRPEGVLPPLGPGGRQAVSLRDGRLPLQEAGENRHVVLHIFVGSGVRVHEVAVEGLLRHRQGLRVGKILQKGDLVLQIGPLKGDAVLPEDPGVKEEAPDEAIEDGRAEPVPQQGIEHLLPQLVLPIDPGGQQLFRRLGAGGQDVPVGAAGGIRAVPPPELPEGRQGLRLKAVVGVQEGDALPLRVGEAHVPGGGHAPVLLVEGPDPGVLGGVGVAEGAGAVGASILDEQQLPVRECLGQDALHAGVQESLRPVNGHDHRDGGHSPPPSLSEVFFCIVPHPRGEIKA